jgi:peptidoglycan/xylan/chitin deacetylase (PgdA/CDA1 family)
MGQQAGKYNLVTVLTVLLILALAQVLPAENVTLCYHSFEYSLKNIYATLPDVFEWQTDYIKSKNIPIISLEEFEKKYDSGVMSGNSVLITLDDGWKSFDNIHRIIDDKCFPITMYIYPSVIGRKEKYATQQDLQGYVSDPLISIGVHSYTHIPLTNLDGGTLKREVIKPIAKIRKITGSNLPLNSFAYPYGMYDSAVKEAVKENYGFAFGVNDESNNQLTDRYNLNRFVLYKNTTFGEFMEVINHIYGKNRIRDHRVHALGISMGLSKYFKYAKVKVYEYRPYDANQCVLVMPGSNMGPGWVYKIADKMKKMGIKTYMTVGRNNNLPFYRPDKEMKLITSWGLPEYLEDTKNLLDYVVGKEKNIVILVWGDSFDLLTAAIAANPGYFGKIKGILAVNPSLRGWDGNKESYKKAYMQLDRSLAAGQYSTENMSVFLSIKTLSDMMILKPDSISPFGAELGYRNITNKKILLKALDNLNHPDMSINLDNREFSMESFKEAFMRPMPLFSMLEPIKLIRDINFLKYSDFRDESLGIKGPDGVAVPVVVFYNDDYSPNVRAMQDTFKNVSFTVKPIMSGQSTIEILLSDKFSNEAENEVLNFMSAVHPGKD